MTKLLMSVAILGLMATTAPASATEWKAVAITEDSDPSYYWSGTGYGWSEEEARDAAIRSCENSSGRSCYETRSVPSWWSLVVSNCRGVLSTGGSKHGVSAANARAAYNAGMSGVRCRVLKSM